MLTLFGTDTLAVVAFAYTLGRYAVALMLICGCAFAAPSLYHQLRCANPTAKALSLAYRPRPTVGATVKNLGLPPPN